MSIILNARFVVVAICGLMLPVMTVSAAVTTTGNVTPDPTTATADDDLFVGQTASGTMTVNGGSTVASRFGYVGHDAVTLGQVTVTGTGSDWTSDQYLYIGEYGAGVLHITSGGDVAADATYLAHQEDATGDVTVNGSGSSLAAGSLYVGWRGEGSLTISHGGAVTSLISTIGGTTFGVGEITIENADSTWTNTGKLTVGAVGDGVLNISDGQLTVGGPMELTNNAASTALVNLDGGTLDLQGNNIDKFLGTATFNFTGGTLKHVGTFGFDLDQQGGTLAPGNSPGTTTIDGDYTQSGGVLEIEIGGLTAGTEYDVLNVTGSADMAGIVHVILDYTPSAGDSFDVLNFNSFLDNGYSFDFTQAALPSGLAWDISTFASDGVIRIIPEPGSAGLLLALAGAGLYVRRSRHQDYEDRREHKQLFR